MGSSVAAGSVESLREMVERVRPVSTSDQRLLPVPSELGDLLRGGLRRGSTVQIDGSSGVTSLGLSLCSGITRSGMWLGCMNLPALGWSAAAELGVRLERVVVTEVQPQDFAEAGAVLVDDFDVVLCGIRENVSRRDARRLVARSRERGSVLVIIDSDVRSTLSGQTSDRRSRWPEPADVNLSVMGSTWHGLGSGSGRLRGRDLHVRVGGRRALAREHMAVVRLPFDAGLLYPPSSQYPGPGRHQGSGVALSVIDGEVSEVDRATTDPTIPLRRAG